MMVYRKDFDKGWIIAIFAAMFVIYAILFLYSVESKGETLNPQIEQSNVDQYHFWWFLKNIIDNWTDNNYKIEERDISVLFENIRQAAITGLCEKQSKCEYQIYRNNVMHVIFDKQIIWVIKVDEKNRVSLYDTRYEKEILIEKEI